jgi:hypothetical protein
LTDLEPLDRDPPRLPSGHSPSWTLPMALAAVPALMFGIAGGLFGCCCCTELPGTLFAGAAAFVARDRDPSLRQGQAFLIGAVGNGIGTLVAAIVRVASFGPEMRRTLEDAFDQAREEIRAQNPAASPELLEQQDQVLEFVQGFFMSPVSNLVLAMLTMLVAGVMGLIGFAIAGRRRSS